MSEFWVAHHYEKLDKHTNLTSLYQYQDIFDILLILKYRNSRTKCLLINSYIQEATLYGSLNMPIYESKLVNLIFGEFHEYS